MSRIVVIGAGGFLGGGLARHLQADGHVVTGLDAAGPIGDQTVRTCDITDATSIGEAIPDDTEVVVHLAAAVSAGCERDPALAWRTNVEGTRNVLTACARLARCPRLVFTSTLAVFSGPVGGDGIAAEPSSTYGMTKVIGEQLVAEATRRGTIRGVSVRLPTVIIRPGAPNAAASSFASAVFREPFAGTATTVPVSDEVPIVVIGAQTAVRCLAMLAVGSAAGATGNIALPGLTATTGDLVAASRRATRDHAVDAGAIVTSRDPAIEAIVASWPSIWNDGRSRSMGLPADDSVGEIADAYARSLKKRI